MCGRAYSPHFLFSWPNARVSVMGGDQAASVLSGLEQAKREAASAAAAVGKGRNGASSASAAAGAAAWPPEERAAFEEKIRAKFDEEGSAVNASARLWDDGVIDPRTRGWFWVWPSRPRRAGCARRKKRRRRGTAVVATAFSGCEESLLFSFVL